MASSLHGSARLAQSLLAAGPIDEIRLVIAPTVLGQGRRFFPDHGPAFGMRVSEQTPRRAASRSWSSGVPATYDRAAGTIVVRAMR